MTFRLVGLDADDTLWQNEIYYRQGRDVFDEIIAQYEPSADELEKVDKIEVENLKYFGYGAVGFAVSLAEAAVDISKGQIGAADMKRLLKVAKEIISVKVELIEGAEKAVQALAARWPLLLVTKGDLLHQQAKIKQSELRMYFQAVEVVSEKTTDTYRQILDRYAVAPEEFIMIGNSMRSDVMPVLEIGGWAVHLAGHTTWQFEDQKLAHSPSDRFFEVQNISQVPGLIEGLNGLD